MSVTAQYRQKLVSPATAVAVVKSGDQVDYTFCLSQPVVLDEALAARRDELANIFVRGGMRMQPLRIVEDDLASEHFDYASWHFTAYERSLNAEGRCAFIPMVYRNQPLYYRKSLDVDVAMLCVAPMDAAGNFNLSLTNSATRAIIERAKTVILEINENLPVIPNGMGHTVHISEVDFVVEGNNPALPTITPIPATPTDETIAALLLERIRDGACVQLGIGALPNAIGAMIVKSGLKDLGIHTEMMVDAYKDMAEAGKITNTRKRADTGKSVFSFCAGSQELYTWMHRNEQLFSAPVDYTNAPAVIAQNPGMVTVNSCIECDILGQVTCETSGSRQISGTGGQLDFLTGGYMSPGGQSFICCHSTYTDKKGQRHSRIRLGLPEHSVVSDPRTQAHCLATEWGIADLAGRSVWERTERIINIAHPEFRDELFRGAERLGFRKRSAKKA